MNSRRILRFGVFEADLDAPELRKHGLRVKLQDHPFRVLAASYLRVSEITAAGLGSRRDAGVNRRFGSESPSPVSP